MKNRSRKWLFALLLGCSVALCATGCDKLKKEPETESETEAPTEAPTESETQTESETEPPTEPPTESETQTESETEPKVLTAAEEKAQETEYDQLRQMYAKDDINIRTEPGTAETSEIFSSFMQGDVMTVVGETPNWYKVDVDDYDVHGYVSKQFVSETAVAEKTEEERQQAIEQELSGQPASTAPTDGTQGAQTSSGSTDTASVDAEYGVGAFAESFPIQASTGANVRKTPSQDGEIIQTISSGTTVTALGETDRWYKVDFNGTIGYVNKNLFKAD